MHETEADLEALQRLLDESDARGGPHLRSIFTEERRIPADELCELLTGVQVLNVATVSASGEPLVAPVDGLFYRGEWYFGSSPDSVRMRHIAARPQVSAAHTRGEELAVIVHGRAERFDYTDADHSWFYDFLREVYVPLYGDDWSEWAEDAATYARIDARKMFTFQMRERPTLEEIDARSAGRDST